MDSQQRKKGGSSCFMASILATSILSTTAAVSMVVLISQWGNSGMFSEPSMLVQSCSNSYFTQKFANFSIINRVIFIFCLLASLVALKIGLLAIGWSCRKCTRQKEPAIPRQNLFFFSSTLTIACIPPLGYYFSFYVELKNCKQSTDFSQIIIVLGTSAFLMLTAGLLSILILCKQPQKIQISKEYRVMETYQTQGLEEMKNSQPDWKADLNNNNMMHNPSKYPSANEAYQPNEITHQAIFPQIDQNYCSPIRKPAPQYRHEYGLSHDKPDPYNHPHNFRPDLVKQHSSHRKSPVHMEERIISNLHPRFASKTPQQNQQQKRKERCDNDGESQFFREQHKYIQDMNQNMFPRDGLRQREVYQYHNHPEREMQERRQNNPNYAKVHYNQDNGGPFYSPSRPRNQDHHQNQRKYISNQEPNFYTQPLSFQNRNDQSNNFKRAHRSPNFNHINPNLDKQRDMDQQQQSFQFYEEKPPRNHHYYR